MSKILISVVIPTRNRSQELVHCLRSFRNQATNNFEVVVFDNSDAHLKLQTREVVEQSGVPQARYHSSAEPLAMTDSWEAAVACSKGEHFTIIGDDDTVMPHGLDVLEMLVRKHPGEVINWQPPWYYWSNCPNEDLANTFRLPAASHPLQRHASQQQLNSVCSYKEEFTRLPTVYTSLIPIALYELAKGRFGRFFHTRSPDIGAAFMIGALTSSYLTSPLPFFIAGISGRSNGGANITSNVEREVSSPQTPPQIKDFMSLSKKAAYGYHPSLDGLPVTYAFEVASSAMTIHDLLKAGSAGCNEIRIDLEAALQRAALQIMQMSEDKRPEAWDQMTSWAKRRDRRTYHKALNAVSDARSKCAPGTDYQWSPPKLFGWLPEHGRFIGRLPEARVSNVADFAEFASTLFCYKEIVEAGRLPKCLELRPGSGSFSSGRLAGFFRRMLASHTFSNHDMPRQA